MAESPSKSWFTLKRRSKEKLIPIHISTMDSDLEFNMHAKAKGYELFELVCKILGLRESWYFGLRFKDKSGECLWLRLNKKITEQCPPVNPALTATNISSSSNSNYTNTNNVPHSQPPSSGQIGNPYGNDMSSTCSRLSFELMVKFFPEDVEEIIQTVPTLHLFFLQVCNAILAMEIYCPPEAAVLLASYALQAKHGDYEEKAFKCRAQAMAELPARVISQYQMTDAMWEERIKTWYMHHKGMSRDEAELEYLKIVQDLDMYGLQYFSIINKKKSELWLGVTSLGLNIYERDNKLAPKIFFPWNEIRTVSVDGKKFTIKLLDKGVSGFVFYSHRPQTVKLILELCVGNHDLFLRRRKPDSLEIQQMKIQAREDKLRKQIDRTNYLREQERLEEIARLKTDLESQLENVKKENERINQALKKSEETTELLAEKSRLAQEESYLLAVKARQAEAEVQRLKNTVLLNLTATNHSYNGNGLSGLGAFPYPRCSFDGPVNSNPGVDCNEGMYRNGCRGGGLSSLIPNAYDSSNTSINSTNSSSSQRNSSNLPGPNPPPPPLSLPPSQQQQQQQQHSQQQQLIPTGTDRSGWGATLTNNNNSTSTAFNGDGLNSLGMWDTFAAPSVMTSLSYNNGGNDLLSKFYSPNISNISAAFNSTYPYLLNSNLNEEEIGKILNSVKIMSKNSLNTSNITPNIKHQSLLATNGIPKPYPNSCNNGGRPPTFLPFGDRPTAEPDEGYDETNNYAPVAPVPNFATAQTFNGPDREYELLSGELEKERSEYLEKCKTIRDQLNDLRKDFEILKVADKESDMDKIHSDALKRGETKYSTLKRVKVGTMRSRVAFFEEL